MIQLRLIDAELDRYHPTFAEWWKAHGWPVVPVEALRTMALLAYDDTDDTPLAAAWVYFASTGSFAMLEWLVSNPTMSPLAAVRVVNALVEFATKETKDRGYTIMFTTCRQSALGRVYEKHGFTKTDDNVSHYLKVL